MNPNWPRALLSLGSLFGAAMIAAVQIPPETATSNIAAWARMFGFNRMAVAVAPPAIDEWVTALGLAIAVTCILVGFDIARSPTSKSGESSKKRKATRSR
jgi:hypothetical protein